MFEELGLNNTRERAHVTDSDPVSIMISYTVGVGCSKVIKSPRIPLCFLPFFPCVGILVHWYLEKTDWI